MGLLFLKEINVESKLIYLLIMIVGSFILSKLIKRWSIQRKIDGYKNINLNSLSTSELYDLRREVRKFEKEIYKENSIKRKEKLTERIYQHSKREEGIQSSIKNSELFQSYLILKDEIRIRKSNGIELENILLKIQVLKTELREKHFIIRSMNDETPEILFHEGIISQSEYEISLKELKKRDWLKLKSEVENIISELSME